MPYRHTDQSLARRERTREAIVAGALELVASEGYGAVSMVTMAERVELAVGSIYNYFPSKSELFAEVFRRASGHELDATRAAAAVGGSSRDRLAGTVATFARRSLRGHRLAWALLAEPVDRLVDVERLAFRQAYRDVLAQILADGVAAGELPDQEVDLTAASIVGAIAEVLVGPLSPVAAARDPDEVVSALLTICLRAAGADSELRDEPVVSSRWEGAR